MHIRKVPGQMAKGKSKRQMYFSPHAYKCGQRKTKWKTSRHLKSKPKPKLKAREKGQEKNRRDIVHQ